MITPLLTARLNANLTQQQVADKLAEKLGKMSLVTVRNMEDTETIGKVSFKTVVAYCQLLGIKTIEIPEKLNAE